MASPGAGTTNHLVSELLQARTGARWVTVHYKGNAPATQDLLAGQVQFNFDQVSVSLPYIKDGRLRPLAVTTQRRVSALPGVPTLIELGVADFTAETFTGIVAPAGTPQPILDKLHAALSKVAADRKSSRGSTSWAPTPGRCRRRRSPPTCASNTIPGRRSSARSTSRPTDADGTVRQA